MSIKIRMNILADTRGIDRACRGYRTFARISISKSSLRTLRYVKTERAFLCSDCEPAETLPLLQGVDVFQNRRILENFLCNYVQILIHLLFSYFFFKSVTNYCS